VVPTLAGSTGYTGQMDNTITRTLCIGILLMAVLTACDREASPVDTGSAGQQLGQGYLEKIEEAEAARSAIEARTRELEAFDARLRE
jgi:hypothetical protein